MRHKLYWKQKLTGSNICKSYFSFKVLSLIPSYYLLHTQLYYLWQDEW